MQQNYYLVLLCMLRLKGRFFNYLIICVHAATKEKDKEIKEELYGGLNRLYTIALGNFICNLKVQIDKESIYYIANYTEAKSSRFCTRSSANDM